MSRILYAAALFVLLSVSALRAEAENWLFDPFDGDRLSWADRRFVQMALSMKGDYLGMLDGDWGSSSQQALEDYGRREYGSGYASYIDVGGLMLGTIARISDEGWGYSYFEPLDLSLLVPKKRSSAAKSSKSGAFVDFSMIGGTLGYSLTVGDLPFTARLHEYSLGEVSGRPDTYLVRKPRLLITAGETAVGKLFYTRSDWRRDGWATVMLSASGRDRPLVNMVAGSIRNGRTPEMAIEAGGELVRIVEATVAALAESERAGDAPLPLPDQTAPGAMSSLAPEDGDGGLSSGSGFVVGTGGEVLTNAHVVKGCGSVYIDGMPATIRAVNEDFDLALVDTGSPRDRVAAFAPGPAALNSDVTVIGYPLSGLLGGVNVTRGAVSSLSGLGGDATRMQISAPVQPGNSGGPVADRRGAVVGVVVSKLDAQYMASKIGDIPQNVNFAIRGEIAKLFLSMNGVEPLIAAEDDVPTPEILAARMTKVTTLITCRP